MRSRGLLAIAALGLLCIPRAAAADPEQEAQRHVRRAEQAYRISDYEEAAAQFKAAHRIDPRPDLLFNIARCYEVMARLPEAIRYYQRYLDEKPLARDRALVTGRLRSLRARLLREKERQEPPATRPRPKEEPSPAKRTAGWILAATGAASLAAGIAFGVLAKAKANEFADGVAQQRTFRFLDEVDRTGRAYQTTQIVTLAAGGALLATGSVLLLVDLAERRAARSVVVLPAIGSQQLGVSAHARF